MSFKLSPGVYVKEKDISEYIPGIATSSAALVGYSAKGDLDNILLITNANQFIEEYGEPDPTSGHYFHYTALAFLKKGNVLYCLRVANAALYGGIDVMKTGSAEVNAAFAVGKSTKVFDAPSGLDTEVVFQIMGANPGVWDDRVSIRIPAADIKTGGDLVPTDQYTFNIQVYYQDDDGNDELVETWHVSRKKKRDGFGKQLYLEDKINGVSKYIVVADNADNIAMVDTELPKAQATSLVLDGGSDGNEISSSELILGWKEFENPSDIDIRLLLNGGETAKDVQDEMIDIAEARMDCLAILDMDYSDIDSVTDMLTFRATLNANTSYAALYSPWVKIYDPYNDILINVPPSGYVGAQFAYNDQVGYSWDAPAGFRRGVLDVQSITYVFTEGEVDTLYPKQINPLQLFRGEGNVIWGQKTLQTKTSALSSINVRRLFIMLEKAVAISLRGFVFENNTEVTRFRIAAMLNEYLDKLSSQGAFQLEGGDRGYLVLCDETNNTPAVINAQELHVDVFVKPVRAAEYIQLQVIATPTGASFEELVSRGVQL